MDASARFRINAPRVIHEPFEHEVVIVNLDTGRYYCLQRTGVELWHAVTAGAAVSDIIETFTSGYDAEAGEIERAIHASLDELTREGLIVAAEGPGAALAPAAPDAPRRRFEPPTLQTFTDMQDLLLLDPIHEVDDAGWPLPADPARQDAGHIKTS